MTISESRRFVMQIGLRKDLGDEVAEILLEHLPPSGWSDVARQSDVDRLERRIDRIDERLGKIETSASSLDAKSNALRTSVDHLCYAMWAMGITMLTGFGSIFGLIVSKL